MPKKTTKSSRVEKNSINTRTSRVDSNVRLPPGIAHPVDIHVGDRLRARRTLLGLTQEALADAVDLTFQQIQKYERGANRIGASKLFQFSKMLGVPVGYFFERLDDKLGDPASGYAVGMDYQRTSPPARDVMNRRETLELVRAYYQISNTETRNAIRLMFAALANASEAKANK